MFFKTAPEMQPKPRWLCGIVLGIRVCSWALGKANMTSGFRFS